MNRARYHTLKVGAVSAVVTLVGFYVAGVSYAQRSHTTPRSVLEQMKTKQAKPPQEDTSLQAIHSTQLPAVQEAVARAIQHLEAGHNQEALSELRQIKTLLETLRQALGKQIGPQFLNDRCPIMGTRVNADKVTPELMRTYGQGKVAFCCAGCPAQWDRLAEAEKVAKLKAVAVGSQPTPQRMQRQGMQGMQHQGMPGMQHQH